MENIKKQIAEICVFTVGNSVNAIKEAKALKLERLQHGIKMMKESGLFSTSEIDDISDYACMKLHVNYEEALEKQVDYLKDNWRF